MNDLFRFCSNSFEVNELGKYKSLEIYTFISNQFINHYKKIKKKLIQS